MDREQELVNICFQIAMVAAEYMHGKPNDEIAKWVAHNLKECGFPTQPCGSSWGVLEKT
jgi:hypothetical protein